MCTPFWACHSKRRISFIYAILSSQRTPEEEFAPKDTRHAMQTIPPIRQGSYKLRVYPLQLTSPCSNGLMVPASTLRYGSILMLVTLRPHPCSIRPTLEMVTPFPRPETTPPDTTTYFMVGVWSLDNRFQVSPQIMGGQIQTAIASAERPPPRAAFFWPGRRWPLLWPRIVRCSWIDKGQTAPRRKPRK